MSAPRKPAIRGEALHRLMTILVVAPAFLAFGYSLSLWGAVVSYPSVYRAFTELNTTTTTGELKSHNALVQGAIVAAVTLGGVLGCLSCTVIGNHLGRRKTTFLGALLTLVGTILLCTSFGTAQLCVSRVIIGMGIGQMSATIPVWQAETSRVHKRGGHVILDGICVAGGIAAASWITFGFSHSQTAMSYSWRIPAIIPGVLAILIMSCTFLFPESPRWLVLKGRTEEAKAVFSRIEDANDNERIQQDLEAVMRANEQLDESANFLSLFKYGREKMLYRIILAILVQFFTQMNGAGIITYYSNQLFAEIGLTGDTAKVLGSTSLTFKFICCFIAYLTIERAGRRLLFMISGGGMAICMYALAICGSQTTATYRTPAYVGVVFAFLFVFFLPIAYLGVNFLYAQEVITTRYRAPAAGLSTATHYLCSFIVSFTTPLGFAALSWKFYFIWGTISASIVPAVYIFYPETTDLSVEEIDEVFIQSPSVLKTVATAERFRRERRTGARTEVFREDDKRSEMMAEEASEAIAQVV
ncbi:hypothetical protein D1P53_001511 [Cryptococcus gattii VGV]|nr:hypothetical protein D1P53_001511 [Cryptococcus gattii VGV]